MKRYLLSALLLLVSALAVAQSEQSFIENSFVVDGVSKNMPTFSAGLGTLNCNTELGFGAVVKRCETCAVQGISLIYRIYKTGDTPGGFNTLNASFLSSGQNGIDCVNETWGNASIQSDILQNLANGSYNLDIYFQSNGSNCTENELKSATYSTTFTYSKEPVVTFQPIDLVNCSGQDMFFKTEATGAGTTSYQWERSDGGGAFTTLGATTRYVNPDTKQLKVNNIIVDNHDDTFRCKITDGNGCTIYTRVASASVSRESTIISTSNNICEGQTNLLTSRINSGTVASYQWQYRAGASGSTYVDLLETSNFIGTTALALTVKSTPDSINRYRVEMYFNTVEMDDAGNEVNNTCRIAEPEDITVSPLPAKPAFAAVERCGNGIIELIAPLDATGYRWYTDTTQAAVSTAKTYSPNLTSTQDLFFGYLSPESCESHRAEFTATVNPIPTITLSSVADICPGVTSATLPFTNLANGDLYSITTTDATGFTAVTDASISTSPINLILPGTLAAGTYNFVLKLKNSTTNCESLEIPFMVRVKAATVITTQPIASEVCEGKDVSLSIAATGEGTLTYQWFKDGNAVTGEENATLDFTTTILTNQGKYKCEVTGECGTIASSEVDLTVNPKTFISQQPQSVSKCEDGSATFIVNATGSGTLTYQWKKNGDDIGTNSNSLTISNLQNSDNNSQITCVITSDKCDGVTSTAATLTVIPLPTAPAVTSPTGFCKDETATALTATPINTNSLLWWGNDATGGTSTSIAPTPATTTVGTTSYFVSQIDANSCEGPRAEIQVVVSTPVNVGISPSQTSICATGLLNQTAILQALPSNGNGTFTYRWRNGSGVLSGESSSSITVNAADTYTVEVTSAFCTATESQVITAILSELSAAPSAADVSICFQETATLNATSAFSDGTFRWYDTASGTSAFSSNNPLILSNLTSNRTVYIAYQKTAGITSCETPRKTVNVTVDPQISITTQPQNVTKCEGNTANFAAAVTNATAYQWQRKVPNGNFEDILGENSDELRISSIGNSTNPHLTKYRLIATAGSCSVTTDEVTLFVNSKDANLDSQTACIGSDVTFSVPTTTGIIQSYEWQKRTGSSGSFVAITGGTSKDLLLENVGIAEDNTYYRCRLVFDNGDGSTCIITTDDGRLTVKQVSLSLSKEDVKCFGEASGGITAAASGSSGYEYQLGSGAFQSSNKFENLSAGTYAVNVKDGDGCTASESSTITEPTAIIISNVLTSPATCDGAIGSISFTASGGTGTLKFKLDDGDFQSSSTFSNLSGGTYSVTVEDENGCSITQNDVVVGGKAVPIISAQPTDLTNCEGNTVTFEITASNVTSYQWQQQLPGGSFENISGENTNELRLTNVGNSTNPHLASYRVVLQNDGCDVTSETATLNVNSISGSTENKTLCLGTDYTLDLTNYTLIGTVSAYQWQFRNGTSGSWEDLTNGAGSSLALTNLQTANSGFYRCRITFENSTGTCIEYNETGSGLKVDVEENIPPLVIADKLVVCDGIPAELTVTNCSGVVIWSTGQTGNSIEVSVAGTYVATCSLGNCESAVSNSIIIQEAIAPTTPTITTNKFMICGGEIVEIAAGNCNGLVTWSTTETGNSINVGVGVYTATCSSLCGASGNSNVITITTDGTPSGGTIEATAATNCAGYNPPTITNSVDPTGENLTIQWQQRTTSGDWSDIDGATSETYNPSTLTDTTLYRRKVSNTCGEAFSNVDTIYIAPDPSLVVSSSKSLICSNETFTLNAAVAGGSGNCPISWERNDRSSAPTSSFWESISGTTETLTISDLSNSSTENTTIYYRAIVDCQSSSCNKATADAFEITVQPSFDFTLNLSDSTICEGNSLIITATGCGGAISWSSTETTSSITVSPLTSTSYTATCTNSCGSASQTANITVLPGGVPLPVSTTASGVVVPATLTFTATGSNLKWYAAESGGTGSTTPPSFTELGTYTYWVTQFDGRCESNRLKITSAVYPQLSLTSQSIDQYDCKGNSVTLYAVAEGAGKLNYIWQRKRPGETAFTNLGVDDGGIRSPYDPYMRVSAVGNDNNPHLSKYRCYVLDSLGGVYTNEMTLYVNSLEGTFSNVGDCIGTNYDEDIAIKFKITGDVSQYQWQRRSGTSGPWDDLTDDARFKGTATTRLQITPLEYTDSDLYYRCSVTFNTGGFTCTENTDPSRLTVSGYPFAPPSSEVAYCQFETAKTLSYKIEGSNDVLWYSPDNPNFGDTKAPKPSTDNAGEYIYYITEITPQECESPKTPIKVTIHPEPPAPTSTTPEFVKEGTALTFTADGETLRWFTSRTGRTYKIESPIYFSPKVYKHYVSQLSNFGCESPRTYIEAEIREALKLTRVPETQADCDGNSVTFDVNADSFSDVTYQWERKQPAENAFVKITGETEKKLTIRDVGEGENPDGTLYRCVVKDTEDSLLTNAVSLIVNKISGEIPDVAACEGQQIVLDSTKVKTTGLLESYEWQRQSGRSWITIDSTSKWLDLGIADSSKTADYRLRAVFRVNSRTTCSRSLSETKVVVNEVPTAPITTDYSVCKFTEQKLEIEPSQKGNEIWWFPSLTDSVGKLEPPQNLSETVGKQTFYVAERSDKGCESQRTPLNFTTIPTPQKPVTDSLITSCQFALSVPLSATAENNLLWSVETTDDFAEGIPEISTQLIGTQQLFVVAIDTNGCLSESQRIEVNVQPCIITAADVQSSGCNVIIRENVSGSSWVNFYNADGKLFGAINPNGQNLGTVTLSFQLSDKELNTTEGTRLFLRYFDLKSTLLETFEQPVKIRIFAQRSEISNFNATKGWFVTHYDGTNEDCNPLNNDNFTNGRSVVNNGAVSLNSFISGIDLFEFTTNSFSEFGITDNPFARITTAASVDGNQVVIDLNVIEEIRPLRYFIERSADGVNWFLLREINTSEAKQIIDSQPFSGTSFYRVVYQDLDGTLKYFQPVTVDVEIAEPVCTVFPNPTIEGKTIKFYARNLEPTTFEFFDVSLRKWGVAVKNTEPNNYVLTLSTSLAHGTYFVRATESEEKSCIVKIVKR